MVERITEEAICHYREDLCSESLLSPGLARELKDLVKDLRRFSNWVDAGSHLASIGAHHLAGSGPMSKFLRTLAYTLEKLDGEKERLSSQGIRIDRILLADTASGCSDFRGTIQVLTQETEEGRRVLLEGPFLWDCASHGIPQPQAAQQMGYRCMVSFPECRESTMQT